MTDPRDPGRTVLDMDGRPHRHAPPPPVTDFWFARLEARLTALEAAVTRLERQVWLLSLGASGLLLLEGLHLIAVLIPATP